MRIARLIAEWVGVMAVCLAVLALNAHNDAKPYRKELTTTFCPGNTKSPFRLRLYRAYSKDCRLIESASKT